MLDIMKNQIPCFRFNQCFGILGVLDRLHGTDLLFRSTKNYDRHRTMLTLIPARKQYPDKKD